MPPEGPELESQRELRKHWESEWSAALAVISGASAIEPITIDICQRPEEQDKFQKRAIEEQMGEVTKQIEREFEIAITDSSVRKASLVFLRAPEVLWMGDARHGFG
jgi:hypothetical protein